jgi:hypothetical protein
MIRRLVAAVGLVTVFAGLSGALATPANAGENDNRLCIGTQDERTPGYGHAVCLTDFLPGDNLSTNLGDLLHAPVGQLRLPPL